MTGGIPVQPVLFGDDLDDRFEAFHRSNPHVLGEVVGHIIDAVTGDTGRDDYDPDAPPRPYSIRDAFAVARHQARRAGRVDADGFALNNSYTSRYALLIRRLYPDLAPYIVTRGGVTSPAVDRIAAEVEARRQDQRGAA